MVAELESIIKSNEDLHKLRLVAEGRDANTELKLRV